MIRARPRHPRSIEALFVANISRVFNAANMSFGIGHYFYLKIGYQMPVHAIANRSILQTIS
jgi:hypothetical protein